MDITLIKAYEEVLAQSKKVLEVENKNWPSYIRSEFAELRSAIKKVDSRKRVINNSVASMQIVNSK